MKALIVGTCFIFIGCSGGQPSMPTIKSEPKAGSVEIKAEPIPAKLLTKIKNAEHLRDLVEFGSVTVFENSDDLFLGGISQAFKIENHWYLFDAYLQQVVMADESGKLLKLIGGNGGGPGEFVNAESVKRIWGDHIGVVNQGVIDVYDKSGQFVLEAKVAIGSEQFHVAGPAWSWNDPGTLYIGDFPSYRASNPAHGIFKFDGRQFQKVAGFGDRISFSKQGIPSLGTLVFFEDDSLIWTSNPYRSSFETFDRDGRKLARLPIHHMDVRTERDFQSLQDRRDLHDLLNRTCGGMTVLRLGPLVIAVYVLEGAFFCNIYDTTGTLLRRHLPAKLGLSWHWDRYQGDVFLAGNSPVNPSSWSKRMPANDLEHLSSQGLDLEAKDGPSFVVELSLIP